LIFILYSIKLSGLFHKPTDMQEQHVNTPQSLLDIDITDADDYLKEINELCRVETVRLLKKKLRKAQRELDGGKKTTRKTKRVVDKVSTSAPVGEVTSSCNVERLSELLEAFGT
jgi:hypothetical protein